MDGIILTSPTGASKSPVLTESVVTAGDTETIDIYDADPCPFTKWLVSITDAIAGKTWTAEVLAKHDFSGNVDFSKTNLLGKPNTAIINVLPGINPNELLLSVENNGSNDVDVCAYRMI